MSKSSSTTIVWNGKTDIPDDYLTKVLAQHNQSLGIAFPHPEGFFEVFHYPNTGGLELSQLKNLIKQLKVAMPKDGEVIIVLQDKVQFEDDVGPYSILSNAEGKPLVMAAMDGDFSAHAQETAHAPETFVAAKIKQKAEQVFKMVDGDLVKLMDNLSEDEFFGNGMVNMIAGDRGSIALMSGDGAFFAFKAMGDTTHADTDYGFVSNAFETPQVVEEKLKSLGDSLAGALGLSKSSSSVPAATAAPSGTKRPSLASVEDKPKTQPDGGVRSAPADKPGSGTSPNVASPPADGKVTGSKLPEFLELPIPSQVMADLKKKKTWLSHRIPGGMIPQGYETMSVLKVARDGAPKKFLADYGTHISSMRGLQAVAEAVDATGKTATAAPKTSVPQSSKRPSIASTDPIPQSKPVDPGKATQPDVKPIAEPTVSKTKDTAPHTITAPPHTGVVEGLIPVLSPREKERLLALREQPEFKAGVDRHGQEISDPTKFAENEKKYPNLAHQLGLKSLDDVNWGWDQMVKVATELGPKAICMLALNRNFELKKLEHLNYQLMEEVDKLKSKYGTETAKATGTNGAAPQVSGVRRRPSLAG